MYSDIKSVQILVALLKAHGIKHIVCSPGNRNVPIVHSVESDSFFKTYSVVDERSAGFFGIGLIQRYKEPVAICCTSGTAVCNYYSAIVEAYYQKLPLLVISADRNPCYLNQDEEQMLPQTQGFRDVTKSIVQLPMIKDISDEYVCARKINEAILELEHHGCGPVQINIPLEAKLAQFHQTQLPGVTKIHRWEINADWKLCFERLKKSKILVLYGQCARADEQEIACIENFIKNFDVVFATDPLANLNTDEGMDTFLLSRITDAKYFEEHLCPDIVITLHSGYMSYIRSHLKSCKGKFEHWAVREDGRIVDPFMSISDIFECTAFEFMSGMNKIAGNEPFQDSKEYYDIWKRHISILDKIDAEIKWSDLRAVQMLIDGIPQKSKFHISNSSSIRHAAHFHIDPSIEIFCNRGANGIDGSASSYVGMAYNQEQLAYLLIGDLSFFYDMNSLWNNYISKNMRIILNNNGGATLFHYTVGLQNVPSLDKNIAAEHHASAKSWVESRGFIYIPVNNSRDMEKAVEVMADKSLLKPVFVEVFTDKEKDVQILRNYYETIKNETGFSTKENILKRFMRR